MDFFFFLSFMLLCLAFVSTAVLFHCLDTKTRLVRNPDGERKVTTIDVLFDKAQHKKMFRFKIITQFYKFGPFFLFLARAKHKNHARA